MKNSDESGTAVVGDRELVIGYRLLGVEDAFITGPDEAAKKVMDLFNSSEYGLDNRGRHRQEGALADDEGELSSSIIPLVVFLPSIGETQAAEELISRLARRCWV